MNLNFRFVDAIEVQSKASFLFIGASSALVYYSAVALVYGVIGMRYQVAVSVGYVLSVLLHFFANRHITFRGSSGTLSSHVFRYIALVCINYLITLSIVTAAVELLRINPYLAVAISILATMVVSYLLMRHWIFTKAR